MDRGIPPAEGLNKQIAGGTPIKKTPRRRGSASVARIWGLLESIGFDPYVVLGKDDFEEVLRHGGRLVQSGYARFSPSDVLRSPEVSAHVKAIIREFDWNISRA
jgi:hypothetical protein